MVAADLIVSVGDNPSRIHSEAALAHLCGVAPIPASSGRTHRHRLNRGGDRRANSALHRIALVRMHHDQRTRDYVAKRTKEGLSKKEILRCLKRAIVREVYRVLCLGQAVLPMGQVEVDELKLDGSRGSYRKPRLLKNSGVPRRESVISKPASALCRS
ncbi:transposase-like protein [Corynebacterium diphtheriae bv. mitis]|nr:transposase-like protein [Corynebacterium diphtheriae bv. mitis]